MLELTEKQIKSIKQKFPKTIGHVLKKHRLQKNMTQTELANLTGKDRQYIYKIEKGKVTINVATLKVLLTALEISFETFFKDM